jgi:predicted HicB family RNase H-like nuclease
MKQTKDLESQAEHYANLPYTITIERRDDQGTYYAARVVELPDLLMTGDTPEEAVAELESVKREWIETYLELGNKMPRPLKMRALSGKFQIRLSPTLHEALALRAELDGVSLNKYITSALSRAVGQDEGRTKEKVC